MSYLDVPGASLYYETRGDGPPLLMIPGGNGEANLFRPVAQHLAERYTVVGYDRRGFSRSELKGPQDYTHRIDTDADDAQLLIKHLSKDKHNPTAVVFGSSSGALVALHLLVRHPEVVHTLIPHEPPAIVFLPDSEKWLAWNYEVYDTYKAEGMKPAMLKFMKGVSGGPELAMGLQRMNADTNPGPPGPNQVYWMEHELRQYPPTEFDVAVLAKHSDKLMLAGGRESRELDLFPYRPNAELAQKLGLTILDLPGAHMGFVLHAEQFAKELVDALERRALKEDEVA